MVVETLYAVFTVGLVAAGLVLVGAAARAYAVTGREAMIYLSIGFALIVAATIATAISAYLTGFSNVRTLLLVNNAVSMIGYIFVIYSVFAQ